MNRYSGAILFPLLAIWANGLQAQEFSIHGFVQANYSLRMAGTEGLLNARGQPLPDYILGDERLQVELSRFSDNATLLGKFDLYHDGVDERAGIDLREAYVDLHLDRFELRVGRQIITWGTGDLIFINDVFPKDWIAFLSGRPLEYLKFGSDAINLTAYPEIFSAQLVIIPFYQPDIVPRGERLVAFNPFPSARGRIENRVENSIDNTQLAFRLFRYVGNYDVSMFAYKGFFPSPPGVSFDVSTNVVTVFYPRLNIYGASIQGSALDGVLSLEFGYYDSRDDASGSDPSIENSQIRFLTGYQRSVGENFTLGLQYYGENISQYLEYTRSLPSGFPQRRELRHTLSVRLTQHLRYQTVRLSLFSFYSPNDADYYLNPEVLYEFGDGIGIRVGGTIMGGEKEYTFFGQFEKNDNVYFVLRYAY